MKRKVLAVLGIVLLVASISACGKKAEEPAATSQSEAVVSDTQATEGQTSDAAITEGETSEVEQVGGNEAADAVDPDEKGLMGLVADHAQTVSTEGCDTWTQMADKTLTDGQGYANETLNDEDVFLVALSTFGEDGSENATEAEVFIYDENGAPEYVGFVQSGGSANPLAVKDGMIYTVGHHYVGKHTIKDGELVTVAEATETFDEEGNASYIYNSSEGADSGEVDNEEAKGLYDKLMEEYYDTDMVVFSTVKK